MADDIPEGVAIFKARTLEPGYAMKAVVSAARTGEGGGDPKRWKSRMLSGIKRLCLRVANLVLQPDPQVLWMPAALREGLRVLRSSPYDAIVATAPPFSAFLTGAILGRRTGVPLVLDYRDEWGISNASLENRQPGRVSKWVQKRMQNWAVRHSKLLLATTQASAHALRDVVVMAGSRARVECIYNGFDPDDLRDERVAHPSKSAHMGENSAETGTYRLAYVGTLFSLTSIEPVVNAIDEMSKTRPDLAARLELVFAGRRTGPQEQILDRLAKLPCRLIRLPYVTHAEATQLVRSADGVLALLSDVPGAERVVPAKVFEYMAARRQIIAVAPRGELWDILKEYPAANCLLPGDMNSIADALAHAIENCGNGQSEGLRNWNPTAYSRPAQAERMGQLLQSIAPSGLPDKNVNFLPIE
ncbi:MAG TPA: glycosyltransferase [Tepidisphaeraceae bacterium]|nr:glycosyltransferase [Tepidisphaeraceae bacterium]